MSYYITCTLSLFIYNPIKIKKIKLKKVRKKEKYAPKKNSIPKILIKS